MCAGEDVFGNWYIVLYIRIELQRLMLTAYTWLYVCIKAIDECAIVYLRVCRYAYKQRLKKKKSERKKMSGLTKKKWKKTQRRRRPIVFCDIVRDRFFAVSVHGKSHPEAQNDIFLLQLQAPKTSKPPPMPIYLKRNHVSRNRCDVRIRKLNFTCTHDARKRRQRNWTYSIRMHSITHISIGHIQRKSSSTALEAVAISLLVRTYAKHIFNAANITSSSSIIVGRCANHAWARWNGARVSAACASPN